MSAIQQVLSALKAASVPAGWTPASIGTIWAYYESDSYSQADGSSITTNWTDKSGNSRTATTSGLVYKTNILGTQPSLRTTSGGGVYMPSMTALTGGHFYIVLRVNSTSTNAGHTLGFGGTDHYPYSDGSIYDSFGSTVRKGPLTTAVTLTNWHVHHGYSKPSDWKAYQNGNVFHSTTSNTVGFASAPRLLYNGFFSFNGDIAAAYFFSDKLSDTDDALMQNYIYSKYGNPYADAFLSTTGITDPTIVSAIRTLCSDFTTAGLWPKMQAVYPFVGGTTTTHKFNLKDPRDADASYRIVWAGTVTHNANGVTGDASTGYGDTKYVPSTTADSLSHHLSVYSRSVGAAGQDRIELGAFSGSEFYWVATRQNGNFSIVSRSVSSATIANSDGSGFYVGSRVSSTDFKGYKNGTQVSSQTDPVSQNLPPISLTVSALNNGGVKYSHSDKNIAFATIGKGLTPTEVAALSTAVQTFQTTLGRNV